MAKDKEFEKGIVAGEGNVMVSATLAKELFNDPNGKTVDTASVLGVVKRASEKLKAGETAPLVERLNNQLTLLDTVFTRIAALSMNQESQERMLALLDMALKVQNHCRRTSSTIHEMTRPAAPVSFIKANNANVATNQQINFSENELNVGGIHEMDTRGSSETSRADQRVEALGEVDGSKVRRGEDHQSNECAKEWCN